MDKKTGIFTVRQFSTTSERDLNYMKHLVMGQVANIVAGIEPGRLFAVAITKLDLDYGEGDVDVKIEQQALIALLKWEDAQVGDCVVWDGDQILAREVVPGEIWHFAPYGIFSALGRFYDRKTHLKIFQRVD